LLKLNDQRSFTIFSKNGRSFLKMRIVKGLSGRIEIGKVDGKILEAVFSAEGPKAFGDFHWIAEGADSKFPAMPGCVEINRIEI
jgi:hypothetical protein